MAKDKYIKLNKKSSRELQRAYTNIQKILDDYDLSEYSEDVYQMFFDTYSKIQILLKYSTKR